MRRASASEIEVAAANHNGSGSTWQSTRPVLWANLIAWPAGAWVMHRWLAGFAYHVELDPLWFAAATSISLALALLTVSVHCYREAREKPVKALRYE